MDNEKYQEYSKSDVIGPKFFEEFNKIKEDYCELIHSDSRMSIIAEAKMRLEDLIYERKALKLIEERFGICLELRRDLLRYYNEILDDLYIDDIDENNFKYNRYLFASEDYFLN